MDLIKKVLPLSIAAFAAQLIANWIYSIGIFQTYLGKTEQLFSVVTPATGIGGQKLGTTLLGYLGGLFPQSLMGWGAFALGTFAIIYLGFLIYESKIGKKINMDKTALQRLVVILFYGHVVLYGIFFVLGLGVPGVTLTLAIGLLVNLLIVSLIVVGAAKYLKWPKV